jgi:stalled ribosome rescue protein Dom34
MSHFHAVVWLDHAEARVFQFNPEQVESKVVHTHGHTHVHHKAGVIGAGKMQDERQYFDAVASALDGVNEVLVVGPGTAKLEFIQHVSRKGDALEKHIVEVKTLDRLTDNQIVAHGRAYFARTDRMRPQR